MTCAAIAVAGKIRSEAPVSGSRRSSARAHTGRASAAAATAMTRPVAPMVAAIVRRRSSSRPSSTACSSSTASRMAARSSRYLPREAIFSSSRAASRSARAASRRATREMRSTKAASRSTRTAGSFMSASAAPACCPVLSVTHSRSSTTRTNARLPAVSPTGRKSAPRKLARNASIATLASATGARPSNLSARARHASAACRRSSPWWRGASTNSAAGTHTASAMVQPIRRSPSGPGGVHVGSTNVNSVARWPAAIVSVNRPENVTTTPMTNIANTDHNVCGATSVPRVIMTNPLSASPAYASARAWRLPGKSENTSSATDPNIV